MSEKGHRVTTVPHWLNGPQEGGSGDGWGVWSTVMGVGGWSGVDLEGQELLRVHVVERAQVRQFEEQFSEDGDLVGVVLGDQAAQSSNQSFLKGLHRVDVLKTRAIYGKHIRGIHLKG